MSYLADIAVIACLSNQVVNSKELANKNHFDAVATLANKISDSMPLLSFIVGGQRLCLKAKMMAK